MSKSLLNIISSSKLPNFIIMKHAYIYNIVYQETKNFIKKNMDMDFEFDVFISYKKNIEIKVKSDNQYLMMFFKMSSAEYQECVSKILIARGIIHRKNQVKFLI